MGRRRTRSRRGTRARFHIARGWLILPPPFLTAPALPFVIWYTDFSAKLRLRPFQNESIFVHIGQCGGLLCRLISGRSRGGLPLRVCWTHLCPCGLLLVLVLYLSFFAEWQFLVSLVPKYEFGSCGVETALRMACLRWEQRIAMRANSLRSHAFHFC